MRHILCLLALSLPGCSAAAVGDEFVASTPDEKLPDDLGSRKQGVDWSRFLGPTGDSVSPEKGIITDWPKNGLKILWTAKINEGYSMPTISRGRLFLFDRRRDLARLRCMNSETGEVLWSFDYPVEYEDSYGYSNGPRCFPVVDGGRVYIYGPEGTLHCLRVADGKVVWKLDTKKAYGFIPNFFGVGSTPVIEGDLLLVMVGGSPPGSEKVDFKDLRSNGSTLVAFDKYTGKEKYKTGNDLASYSTPTLATIDGRRWCFIFARGGLIGLDPATGKIDFEFPWRARVLESVNAASPVVVGNKVLISETYGPGSALLEVKPGSCKEIWTDAARPRNPSLQCHWNTPIHVNGYVYGSSGRHLNNAELRCVELATGKVIWSKPNLTRTSLTLIDGHFLCLGEDGVLRLLKVNPEKYQEIARMEPHDSDGFALLHDPCWAAPVVSHGLLYVRGRDRLVCMELIPAKN